MHAQLGIIRPTPQQGPVKVSQPKRHKIILEKYFVHPAPCLKLAPLISLVEQIPGTLAIKCEISFKGLARSNHEVPWIIYRYYRCFTIPYATGFHSSHGN